MHSTNIQQAVARVGYYSRAGSHHPEKLAQYRRELTVLKIEAAATRLLADAPPLTAAERDYLAAALLANGGAK